LLELFLSGLLIVEHLAAQFVVLIMKRESRDALFYLPFAPAQVIIQVPLAVVLWLVCIYWI
jgi:hypothetical protein